MASQSRAHGPKITAEDALPKGQHIARVKSQDRANQALTMPTTTAEDRRTGLAGEISADSSIKPPGGVIRVRSR